MARTLGLDEETLAASVTPTGPWGAPNPSGPLTRWICQADVLEHLLALDRPTPFVATVAGPPRDAIWRHAADDALDRRPDVFAELRAYPLHAHQEEAVRACADAEVARSGLVVMPCGSGKTFVGSALIVRLRAPSVVVTTHHVSVQQWKRHLLGLGFDDAHVLVMGDHDPPPSTVRLPLPPVILCTYAMFARSLGAPDSAHHLLCKALTALDVGLLVLDEVHSAPARTFSRVCAVRARCAIGLTATLCREDDGIDALMERIGGVLHTADADALVRDGKIAGVTHAQLRVPMSARAAQLYRTLPAARHTIAALNGNKLRVLLALVVRHCDQHILVFCDLVDALRRAHRYLCRFGVRALGPICGATAKRDRIALFRHFERAASACLLISKVGDNALDVPTADVVIKLTTVSKSRNQEEQRNGRGARARADKHESAVYTLTAVATHEETFFEHRRRHLAASDRQPEQVDLRARPDALGVAWERDAGEESLEPAVRSIAQ